MDLTTTFIVLQTGWDLFVIVLFSILFAFIVGIALVFFQDKLF